MSWLVKFDGFKNVDLATLQWVVSPVSVMSSDVGDVRYQSLEGRGTPIWSSMHAIQQQDTIPILDFYHKQTKVPEFL